MLLGSVVLGGATGGIACGDTGAETDVAPEVGVLSGLFTAFSGEEDLFASTEVELATSLVDVALAGTEVLGVAATSFDATASPFSVDV